MPSRRSRFTGLLVAVAAVLSLQASLVWASLTYDGDIYAGGVYEGGGSYHPWAFVMTAVLGTAFVAAAVALVAYLRRSRGRGSAQPVHR